MTDIDIPALIERARAWAGMVKGEYSDEGEAIIIDLAAALERMAREVAEKDRLREKAIAHYTAVIGDQAARIRELEAERDRLKDLVECWDCMEYTHRVADAIKAKTREECASLVQAMADKLLPGPVTEDGKLLRDAWLDAADNIRALNQPAGDGNPSTNAQEEA